MPAPSASATAARTRSALRYCITVDFDTVGDEAKGIAADNCVTVRDRDTMEQVRMPISELKSYIESKIEF